MDVEQRALPPLPMHRGYLLLHNTGGISQVNGYTEKQMTEYARAATAALTPPEGDMGNPISVPDGFVLVPVEPTEEMLDAGRAAVMAEHCAGPKWTPRQHFEASGRSMAGIPKDVLDERGPLTKESTAAMVFGSMIAARPEVKP